MKVLPPTAREAAWGEETPWRPSSEVKVPLKVPDEGSFEAVHHGLYKSRVVSIKASLDLSQGYSNVSHENEEWQRIPSIVVAGWGTNARRRASLLSE